MSQNIIFFVFFQLLKNTEQSLFADYTGHTPDWVCGP